MTGGRILVVDDKANVLQLFEAMLSPPHHVTGANDGNGAIALACSRAFDVVITDMRMPGPDGLEVLRQIKRLQPDVEVILMTAYGSVQSAVDAIKAGAYDYLPKPFETEDALIRVERAMERKRLREQARDLRAALAGVDQFRGLVGRSAAMKRAFEALHGAASSQGPFWITGEIGTGRTVAARAIHGASVHATRACAVLDCRRPLEKPEEAELIAYLGRALASGRAEHAGVVVIDNIDDAPPALQSHFAELLRQHVRCVRGGVATPTVCVVGNTPDSSSTRLYAVMKELATVHVQLPPLRARPDDIPLLVAHFVAEVKTAYGGDVEGFAPDALTALLSYAWPGNVRELKDAVERALSVIDGPNIPLEALPEPVRSAIHAARLPDSLLALPYKEAIELARERAAREYLIALMRRFAGNVTKAAEAAGLERESLHRLLKRYGLRSNEFKPE